MKFFLQLLLGATLLLGVASCTNLQVAKAPEKSYPTIRKGGKTYKVIPASDYLMRQEVTPPPAPGKGTTIVVSLEDKRAWLYQDGLLVHTSAVCTGKPGHRTPTGTFGVIAKHEDWTSTIYHVPMPHFLRLNALGGMVGLHAGQIALEPASHGCIRLPADMAQVFFENTPVGTKVKIIEKTETDPQVGG
jgi:lipoprotein-anchoring transpeptidase ErfK/SrfK